MTRLSRDTVIWIKRQILLGFNDTEISKFLKIPRETVKNISHNKSWKHVIYSDLQAEIYEGIEPSLKMQKEQFIQWSLGQETDECILWPFKLSPQGYGPHCLILKKCDGDRPFPEAEARHLCGTRACINKNHLVWGTAEQNQEDRIIHKTDNRGERCGTHKLTEGQVLLIRELISRGHTQRAIASSLEIHQSTVSDIITGRTWSYL